VTIQSASALAPGREAHGEILDRTAPDELLFVADYVASHPLPIDGYAGTDDYAGQGDWSATAMARAHVYQRLVTHIDSANQLEAHFHRYPGVADALGFDSVPNFRTVNRSWREQFDATTKENLKGLVKQLRKDLLDAPPGPATVVSRTVKTQDGAQIPQEEKEAAYAKVEHRLHDLLDYDRSENARIPAKTFTDFASYCARNTYFPEEGSETWAAEAARNEQELFNPETFRQSIRKKGRQWAVQNTAHTQPVDPGADVDDLDWSLDAYDDDYGGDENWHSLTEEAIEKTVDTLRENGALNDSVPIAIDGSVRNYHKHGSTVSDPPEGVHKSSYYDTKYGWVDLSATALIGDRAVVLGNISYTPENDFFACVKYLIDRCRELVDVDCFYADSEFANTDIMRYIGHVGEDYIFKAREHDGVKASLDDFSGDADWEENFTMKSSRKDIQISTTLFAIESDYRSEVGLDQDTHEQVDLAEFDTVTGQATFDDFEFDKETDYEAFYTNKTIRSEGIKPSENPVAHDTRETVWGLARTYRRRWSIETAFRQIKYQFSARTATRDLGVRRFFWMLALVLYNAWATANLLVQQAVPEWDYDRPPIKGNVFLVEISVRLRPPPG